MNPFVWRVRVYWEDTDAGGVVYHSQYLNFFERARTEWLRAKGVHQAKIAEQENVLFAIRHMDIDFVNAARLDDELDISRGDMIVRENNSPTMTQDLDIMLCWFDDKKPLQPGGKYSIQHTSQSARCIIKNIHL